MLVYRMKEPELEPELELELELELDTVNATVGDSKRISWMGFREAKPSVTLNCDEVSPCSEKLHSVQHVKNLPKDLQHLAQLVANPQTQESVWLNACVAAGSKTLVPKPSKFPWLAGMLAVIGASFSVIALFFNFITAMLLSSDAAYLFNQVDPNIYLKSLIDSHVSGCLVAVFSGCAFWFAFLVQNTKLRRFLVTTTILSLAALLQITSIDFLNTPAALAVTSLGVATSGILAALASICREALPKTFPAAAVAKSVVGILSVPVVLMAIIIALGNSGALHTTSSYSLPTVESAVLFSSILFFSVFGQSLAIARASKSSSLSACLLLSACVQAPLVLGLLFTSMSSAFKSSLVSAAATAAAIGDPILYWSQFGHVKAIFSLETAVLTMVFAGAGCLIGAGVNARKAKL
ncbi:hypothetical protein BH11CYA1_BH11CYA1_29440 [soil metagenome]